VCQAESTVMKEGSVSRGILAGRLASHRAFDVRPRRLFKSRSATTKPFLRRKFARRVGAGELGNVRDAIEIVRLGDVFMAGTNRLWQGQRITTTCVEASWQKHFLTGREFGACARRLSNGSAPAKDDLGETSRMNLISSPGRA